MKHYATRDDSDRRILDLSGGCLRHVVLWCVQQFRRSSLLARYTDGFVFSILRTSPGIFWGHIKLKVPPKIDYMKHATTSDRDDLRICTRLL